MTLPLGTDTGHRTTADPCGPFTLEPDRAFLGCLMQTSIAQARRLLAGVRPDDACSSIAQQVLSLVIRLVVEGIKPDPVVLLFQARNQGWLNSEYRHKRFAEWLIDTFRSAPVPEFAAVVKTGMLEQALRWALREQAQRVLDLVEHGPIDRLREHATWETDRIADLWDRYRESARTTRPADPETTVTGHINACSDRLSRPPASEVSAHRRDRAEQSKPDSSATKGDHTVGDQAARPTPLSP